MRMICADLSALASGLLTLSDNSPMAFLFAASSLRMSLTKSAPRSQRAATKNKFSKHNRTNARDSTGWSSRAIVSAPLKFVIVRHRSVSPTTFGSRALFKSTSTEDAPTISIASPRSSLAKSKACFSSGVTRQPSGRQRSDVIAPSSQPDTARARSLYVRMSIETLQDALSAGGSSHFGIPCVMAVLVTAIHAARLRLRSVNLARRHGVDGRDKHGHDGGAASSDENCLSAGWRGDEGLRVHGALTKGLRIVNPSITRPSCMSSLNSVSQPASSAAAAMRAS